MLKQLEDMEHLPLYAYRCGMTEVNKDKGQFHNAVTEAWSKNWLVPVVLLMLRQWSSYGYEIMEKMAAFGLTAMNAGTFYRTLRKMEKDGMVSSNWDTLRSTQMPPSSPLSRSRRNSIAREPPAPASFSTRLQSPRCE